MISAKVLATGTISFVLTFGAITAFGQNTSANAGIPKNDKPRFVAADIHVSAKGLNQNPRSPSTHGDIFEARYVTMADLIGFAYNTPTINVVGGPNWLEMEHFDLYAKQPPQTPPDQTRLMLRGLLADRFKLVVRDEVQPMPGFALTAGAKRKLKQGDGSVGAGCVPQSSSGSQRTASTLRYGIPGENGLPTQQLTIYDGMVEYSCRNMTMAAFATALRGLVGLSLGESPIIDQTNLAGTWNFYFKYSPNTVSFQGSTGKPITIVEAVDKQLGLKLEEKQIPTAVVAVKTLSQKPVDNPAGTEALLARPSFPKTFEVATFKPTASGGNIRSRVQTQPGGRIMIEGYGLNFLLMRAFVPTRSGELVGVPSWANDARFDLVAQARLDPSLPALDSAAVAPMMLALLKQRFGLTFHTEQRDLEAYNLVAAKPRMKKADPAARTWCKTPAQVPGSGPPPQGAQTMICQNITMSQFAGLLQGKTSELRTPVVDSTGLQGGWDFGLTFMPDIAAVRAAAANVSATNPTAGTPDIVGSSIFEAVEKQLGLKLEKVKRPAAVTVIDHLDRSPTEN